MKVFLGVYQTALVRVYMHFGVLLFVDRNPAYVGVCFVFKFPACCHGSFLGMMSSVYV